MKTQEEPDEAELIRRAMARKPASPRKPVTPEAVFKAASYTLGVLRDKKPLVQVIANPVAAPMSEMALLSIGARSMYIADVNEATAASALADGLLVNLGGVTKGAAEAIRAAVGRNVALAKPWVLDAEGVGPLPFRTFLARELVKRLPGLIIADDRELVAVSGESAQLPGDEYEQNVLKLADRVAVSTHATVLLKLPGKICVVSEGVPTIVVDTDDAIVSRVAGFRCANAAVAAAFLGLLKNHKYAAGATTAVIAQLALKSAKAKTDKPGSCMAAYADALFAMAQEDVSAKNVKLSIRP